MNKCKNCGSDLTGEILQKGSCDTPLQRCVKCKHVMAYVGIMRNEIVDLGDIKLIGDKI
jgi:uncharacterized Zn finger protein